MWCREFVHSNRESEITNRRGCLGALSAMLAGWLLAFPWSGLGASVEAPGLEVAFSTQDSPAVLDRESRSKVSLFVPDRGSPSPFLPSGPFRAEWTGFISVDLRSDFRFQIEAVGRVGLDINGKVIQELEAKESGAVLPPTELVRLSKGTNAIRVRYLSPKSGDAWIRLSWFNRDTPPGPVPSSAFSHRPSAEATADALRRRGRDLFLESRCIRCHDAGSGAGESVPDLAMDAPVFEGIGSRRKREWIRDWVLDPKKHRASARMPRLLKGEKAVEEADAVAAYLSSLVVSGAAQVSSPSPAGSVETGGKLFESLHCGSCHTASASSASDLGKIDLSRTSAKFTESSLRGFLKQPEEHFRWVRMPNFNLSDEEAAHLATFLFSLGPLNTPGSTPSGGEMLARGRKLLEDRGCVSCHDIPRVAAFKAKPLASMAPERWGLGCLAASPDDALPDFGFSEQERAALSEFGRRKEGSLRRHVAADFSRRHGGMLQCIECHGKVEGVPAFEPLGEKLKAEYVEGILSGTRVVKPRPWLAARMPAFPVRAAELSAGMAHQAGFSSLTPPEGETDPEMVRTGAKLVSSAGGFSCISCHGAGSVVATQVFEAPGINLALSGRRLRKDYFHRWLRNPLALDPSTKMPVYFDEEGRSPLTEILGGDGTKQREAIWQYLLMGERIPAPPAP